MTFRNLRDSEFSENTRTPDSDQQYGAHPDRSASERNIENGEMDYALEVVIVPVSDVDRAMAFYTERAGFVLDIDYMSTGTFRVVQLTPPGSACSVQIGVGLADASPGSVRSLLVVTDIVTARRELTERGVKVSGIRHKTLAGGWRGGYLPGVDPNRGDYASFVDFVDPDGNTWVVQERGFRRS